jgi:hypothetical protein
MGKEQIEYDNFSFDIVQTYRISQLIYQPNIRGLMPEAIRLHFTIDSAVYNAVQKIFLGHNDGGITCRFQP